MSFRGVFFWLAVAYIIIVIVWRLSVAVLLVIGSYADEGLKGAIGAAFVAFVVSVWDLLKFVVSTVILVFIISLIFRACS